MNEITPETLQEFKSRMRIFHSSEDSRLTSILEASVSDITVKCGSFDIATHKRAKELVFERARYAYNDSLEYFDDNFISQLTSLSLELYEPSEVDNE